MSNPVVSKLGMYASLVVMTLGLAVPSFANTISSHPANPDRNVREHRDGNNDAQHNNPQSGDQGNWKPTGGNDAPGFRPERVVRLDKDKDNDNDGPVDIGPVGENDAPPTTAPDTAPVPEPSTLLLVAPAAFGMWRKLRK